MKRENRYIDLKHRFHSKEGYLWTAGIVHVEKKILQEECTGMKKTVQEQGIPNDIYRYLSPEDASDEFEQFLWCDKVGGKNYWAGRCSDAYSEISKQINRSKQKRRNKRERNQKHKDHFEKLWNAKKHKWFPPVLYVDYIYINHEIFDREVPYYKRLTPNHGGRYQRYCKKQANRHVRRYTGEISNGGNYKKVYEYKWSIH